MWQVKRALYLQLFGLLLAALFVLWLARTFPVMTYVLSAQEAIAAMHFWGGVFYPVLYAFCNVLLLPAGILAIGSGFFFGLWWGFFLNLVGSLAGSAIAFAVSRRLGRPRLVKRFFQKKKWAALDDAIGRDGWK